MDQRDLPCLQVKDVLQSLVDDHILLKKNHLQDLGHHLRGLQSLKDLVNHILNIIKDPDLEVQGELLIDIKNDLIDQDLPVTTVPDMHVQEEKDLDQDPTVHTETKDLDINPKAEVDLAHLMKMTDLEEEKGRVPIITVTAHRLCLIEKDIQGIGIVQKQVNVLVYLG